MSYILQKQSGKKLAINSFYCTNCPISSKNFQAVDNFSNFWQESMLNIQALKMAVEISKAIFFLQTQNGHGYFQDHFFSSKHKMAMEISKATFFSYKLKMAMEISKANVYNRCVYNVVTGGGGGGGGGVG